MPLRGPIYMQRDATPRTGPELAAPTQGADQARSVDGHRAPQANMSPKARQKITGKCHLLALLLLLVAE